MKHRRMEFNHFRSTLVDHPSRPLVRRYAVRYELYVIHNHLSHEHYLFLLDDFRQKVRSRLIKCTTVYHTNAYWTEFVRTTQKN